MGFVVSVALWALVVVMVVVMWLVAPERALGATTVLCMAVAVTATMRYEVRRHTQQMRDAFELGAHVRKLGYEVARPPI